MTDKDKLDYLGYIKGFIDEATAAFLRGDDDTYFEALDSVDALLMCLCLLYTSPSPRDGLLSRMPSSA